ncbi:hypothetical protein TW65_01777 [Stemphylium lycopersici]|nr:hypothetical protein TW65_01777 [Stemphylium lycopersici]
MHLSPLVTLLLLSILPLTLAHPKASNTGSTIWDAAALPHCPSTHYPTFSQYKAAISQYCSKHFSPSKWLRDDEKVVLTYTLKDGRGYPIKWILSVTWDQLDFQPGGKLLVYQDDCMQWFQEFYAAGEEGHGWCRTEGVGKKLLVGGRRNGIGGGVEGNKIWVETRKRLDDYFEPPEED